MIADQKSPQPIVSINKTKHENKLAQDAVGRNMVGFVKRSDDRAPIRSSTTPKTRVVTRANDALLRHKKPRATGKVSRNRKVRCSRSAAKAEALTAVA